MSNKPSITRIVKFIRKGENGNSVIVADTASRHYTYAQWQIYGTVGHLETWGSINNVAKFKVGDTIVINGVCTDRGNISVSLYATVGAVNAENKSVTATTTSLIMSGENGTNINVKGSVKAHYANFAALTGDGTGAQDGDKFILDDSSDYSETSEGVTQKGYAAPSVMVYWNAPDFTWSVAKAAVGDCYTDEATGHMWVAEEKIWKDAGKVKGEDGQDGVNIGLVGSPLAINASEINAGMTGTRTWTARVRVYQGAKRIAVTGITLDNSYSNVVTASVDGGEGVVAFTANSANWAAALLYAFPFSANGGIPFTVAYTDKGGTERTADGVVGVSCVQNGANGEKGERGPALRGPQDWEKLPVGYSFQAGKDGDEWKDVVVYKGNYASCIKGHTKTSTNYPGSTDDSNNGYWSVTNKWEIVATNILLTSYALIKNLGVEVIDMKDSDGNILFQAKDGKVVCKTGTFENVSVNGIIHSSLTYSSVKRIVNLSSYTIDPQKEAFNTLFVSTGSTCRVYLPDANAYEGLELNIYQNVVSTMELGSVIMSTYNQSQRIYCSNGTALINGTVVMTINSLPMGDNNFKIIPNILTRLLAVNGNWYVLSGALTGE